MKTQSNYEQSLVRYEEALADGADYCEAMQVALDTPGLSAQEREQLEHAAASQPMDS